MSAKRRARLLDLMKGREAKTAKAKKWWEKLSQTPKEEPQPQVLLALGLVNTNPLPLRPPS